MGDIPKDQLDFYSYYHTIDYRRHDRSCGRLVCCDGHVTNRLGAWHTNLGRVDRDSFCTVVCLEYTDQTISQLKHVVPQGDDDELGVFCSFLEMIPM